MEGVLEDQNQCLHRCKNFWLKTEAESAFNRAEISARMAAFIEQHMAYICMHLKNRSSVPHSQNT